MGRPKMPGLECSRRVEMSYALRDDLRLVAAMRGVSVSQVIREALTAYCRKVLRGSAA